MEILKLEGSSKGS